MQVSFVDNKVVIKQLFKTVELTGREIQSIEITAEGTTIRLYDRDKSFFCKNQAFHVYLYPELGKFIVENHITYTVAEENTNRHTKMETQEMVEQTKRETQRIVAAKIKEKLGERYDAHTEVVGDLSYSILVVRLMRDGVVLYEHPGYDLIEEFGVDKAIASIDLTWLEGFDGYSGEGVYGVTEEVSSLAALERYYEEDYFRRVLNMIVDMEQEEQRG